MPTNHTFTATHAAIMDALDPLWTAAWSEERGKQLTAQVRRNAEAALAQAAAICQTALNTNQPATRTRAHAKNTRLSRHV